MSKRQKPPIVALQIRIPRDLHRQIVDFATLDSPPSSINEAVKHLLARGLQAESFRGDNTDDFDSRINALEKTIEHLKEFLARKGK
jgi:hypothetical protein